MPTCVLLRDLGEREGWFPLRGSDARNDRELLNRFWLLFRRFWETAQVPPDHGPG